VKFLSSPHRSFVVQLSEWKVNPAKSDALPLSPVMLKERQESWNGSVHSMVSVGLLHVLALLKLVKLGAHS